MQENVSIAMATYNGAKYLREQLDSLYSQTIRPFEVIACDDGSVDGTIDILKEYCDKYGLKYFVNKKNIGVNKNFEKALRLTTGNYISICDQDDIWLPNKIEKMLEKMREYEDGKPCVVSSQSKDFTGNNEKVTLSCRKKDSVGVGATLLHAGNVQGCTLMLNRKMINLMKPFPISYKETMMYDCYISFVAATCGVKYNIAESLMLYRHHETNVLAKNIEKVSLKKRLFLRLKAYKFDRLFPFSRCASMEYIYKEYQSDMTEEALPLVKAMIAYGKSNFIERIKIIFEISQYTFLQKVEHVFGEFFAIMIPQKFFSRL